MQSRPRPILLVAFFYCAALSPLRADPIDFNRDVRPILAEKCFACHGPDTASGQADLRLDVPDSALRVIEIADPSASELFQRVTSSDPDFRMPPPDTGKRVTPAEVDLLRRWISDGAEYVKHWAFVPPRRPSLPSVSRSAWPRNGVDYFVLARLEAESLAPSADADKSTLIRRVSFDLTGMPPTHNDVADFVADQSPHAYETVVDRLLDSPRYGEHMASFWLDAARYADTDGYQGDRYRYMHAWRDWVLLAMNDNKPFDDFVVEQLAGDMIVGATLKQQIATGFCRNHRITSEDGSIPAEWQAEYVSDRVDTFGTVFLGLTIGCARCHDHKFDPISQQEYYQLFAYFNNVPEWGVGPNNGNSPPFIEVPPSWPNLAATENSALVSDPVKLRPARENEVGNGLMRPQPGGATTAMVMHEMDNPRPTYLLKRGLYNQPDKSERLEPAVPASLRGANPDRADRLGLARWLVNQDNPLTARVAVNRYWQQFFGTRLVKTSENFGAQGEPPSHPRLLDWLAIEFLESGWNVKRIQKTILMSSTYRQSSTVTAQLVHLDPENRRLARGPRFRLSPFALRDQALAVSGLLVEKIGGPPAKPYMPPKIWSAISSNKYEQGRGESLYRRSLYTYWRRTIPPPMMLGFNAADREVCVVRKGRTNTPLQALTLMNNVTFVEAARFLAERMIREGGADTEEQVAVGFRLATARQPDDRERRLLLQAYRRFRSHYEEDSPAAASLLAIGEQRRDASLDLAQHAAATMTASLILNLDETITKE
jgi:hypothetical protein